MIDKKVIAQLIKDAKKQEKDDNENKYKVYIGHLFICDGSIVYTYHGKILISIPIPNEITASLLEGKVIRICEESKDLINRITDHREMSEQELKEYEKYILNKEEVEKDFKAYNAIADIYYSFKDKEMVEIVPFSIVDDRAIIDRVDIYKDIFDNKLSVRCGLLRSKTGSSYYFKMAEEGSNKYILVPCTIST